MHPTYYQLGYCDGSLVVTVCPKDFFDNNGHLYDQTPDDVRDELETCPYPAYELTEAVLEFVTTDENAVKQYLEQHPAFLQNDAFDKFLEQFPME